MTIADDKYAALVIAYPSAPAGSTLTDLGYLDLKTINAATYATTDTYMDLVVRGIVTTP